MLFTQWLDTQRYRGDLVGELAEQVHCRRWPHTDDLRVLRVRMTLERATPLAVKALHLAHEEWVLTRHLPPLTVVPSYPLPLN